MRVGGCGACGFVFTGFSDKMIATCYHFPDERIIANVLIHTGSMRKAPNSGTAAVHSSASAKKVKLS
jgi:hypothetical protein